MANLTDLATIPPLDIWGDSVRARAVEGERITFAVVELAPGAVVPEHRHEAEQVGIVIEGTVTFTIADETRDLGPAVRGGFRPRHRTRSSPGRPARS